MQVFIKGHRKEEEKRTETAGESSAEYLNRGMDPVNRIG